MLALDQCIKGHIYEVHSRNLHITVYDGKDGFIGIRQKFDDRYLFTEYHWDKGGTVKVLKEIGVLPPDIEARDDLGTIDDVSGRMMEMDSEAVNPNNLGPGVMRSPGWWRFVGGEVAPKIPDCLPRVKANRALFDYLDKMKSDHD
jgi:hypothetical protein